MTNDNINEKDRIGEDLNNEIRKEDTVNKIHIDEEILRLRGITSQNS